MKLHFDITGMSCAGCVSRAERALAAIPGARDAQVNFATHTGQIDGPDAHTVTEALTAAGYPPRTHTVAFTVENMTCASCIARVEAAALAHPGTLNATANLADMHLTVTTLTGTDTAGLRQALAEAGYPATTQTMDDAPVDLHQTSGYRTRFLIAAALTLPVFVAEMGGHLYPPLHHLIARTIGTSASHWIQMLLTLAVLAVPGRAFFKRGVPGLLRARPDMDALVVLGTSAAFAYSVVATLAPNLLPAAARAVYFEAACVIVTLILLGRWLEARAKGRTGDAVRRLMTLAPDTAMVKRGDDFAEVPTDQIQPGDALMARPGDRIAVDGTVTQGTGHVDEAMLTGEPIPAQKSPGDTVIAGCINGAATLHYTATRTGADTTLARIAQMTRAAQATRLPVQALINRVTAWFVPAVIAVSLLTAVAWLWFGDITHALVASVSVLIIACPCAMGLATPVSIMVGTGRAAERGVLFRAGDALQSLQSVRVVAFDKTGTLTRGAPTLTEMIVVDGIDRETLLAEAAAIEGQSDHPIAHAITSAHTGPALTASNVTNTAGTGATGRVGAHTLHIGNAAHMAAEGVDTAPLRTQAETAAATGATPVYIARDGALAGLIAVSDPLRDGAADTVASLKSQGIAVAMITGDTAATADHVAGLLGIDHVTAAVPPGAKADAVRALRDAHGPIAYVGDGINDAPALATADVGLAVAAASDVAIDAADVVLMSPEPEAALRAHAISRATIRNIRQNLAWAFGYNILLIPVAAGVLVPFGGPQLSPSLAAGAMALSSVFVVSNALRLRRA